MYNEGIIKSFKQIWCLKFGLAVRPEIIRCCIQTMAYEYYCGSGRRPPKIFDRILPRDSLTVIKSNNDPTKFNLKKKLTFSYSFCTVKFSTCNRCSSQVTKDFLIIIQKYFALFCKCRLRSGSVFLQRSEQVKNGPDPQHWVNTL